MYASLYSLTVAEYIWIDGTGELRSKTRLLKTCGRFYDCEEIPEWNYDGSSTFQATTDGNTEIILKPRRCYKNPLRTSSKTNNVLVLCDTYDISNNPIPTNYRYYAKEIFDQDYELQKEPWFGLEQEYYMMSNKDYRFYSPNTSKYAPNRSTMDENYTCKEGEHYCGAKVNHIQRKIAEEHIDACINAGIIISGLNSEVAVGQWEFQIGPCIGIQAGDDLYVARYLLDRIAEKYEHKIIYHPKPFKEESGSGCHVNFSTKDTREENGLTTIYNYIEKLEKKHVEHKLFFGSNNEKRLTGKYETADHNTFTWGIGTRNTSIRIGNQTFHEKMGYFEDRRPGANIEPYIVTSQMFKTCCIDCD